MNRSDVLGALAAIALPLSLAGEANAHGPATAEAKAAIGVAKSHAPNAAISVIPSGKALCRGTKQIEAFFERVFTPYAESPLDARQAASFQ